MLLTLFFSAAVLVTVMNPDGITHSNHHFAFGAPCILNFPITASQRGELNGKILYQVTTQTPTGGTECPTGTLFLMTPDAYGEHTAKGLAHQYKPEELRQRIIDKLK